MSEELVGLEIEEREEVVVARLTGELDIAGAPRTGERLGAAVPTAAMGLVVDLSGLEFIDSSGVAMLFGLTRRLAGRRQRLSVVVSPGDTVSRVLEIVELHRAAPVHAGVEEAVADVASDGA